MDLSWERYTVLKRGSTFNQKTWYVSHKAIFIWPVDGPEFTQISNIVQNQGLFQSDKTFTKQWMQINFH